ncbi:MAG: hypothetical protein AAFN77_09560 [Planctomycetota bacterium]
MSDNQRRNLCRFLFLAFCLLPTAITSYWICHPQTPEGWAQAIQAELGLDTEIGSIETPGPYETILRDLRFHDGDRTLFQTVEARIVFGEINRIIIEYPVTNLDSVGLAYLVDRINQHVLRKKERSSTKIWRVDFKDELVIDRNATSTRNTDSVFPMSHAEILEQQRNQLTIAKHARIDVAPTSDGMATTVYFNVRDPMQIDDASTPTMTFEIDTFAGEQVLRLNTHQDKLPVWLLDGIEPEISASLGGDALFAGKLEMSPSDGRVDGLTGKLTQVDVSHYRLVDQGSLAHAEIQIRECQFAHGKFQKWLAMLTAPSILPTEIQQQYLFRPSRQIAPLNAIEQAIQLGRRRFADLPNTHLQ